MDKIKRCGWVDSCTQKYHDEEWGVPVYDDRVLFEMLLLESFQAGLSWVIILKKREGFRKAFDNFDPQSISHFSDDKVQELLKNNDIIKSEAKILAAISNAHVFMEIQKEYGSFADYLWHFTENKVIKITDNVMPDSHANLPYEVSKDMKKRGIKFMGPVTMFAYLQAVGIVNNHDTCCFKYSK